jgi:electron transfer flavoprotein alpha subunit
MTAATHQGVWILAEQAGGTLQTVSFELLARGRSLADKLNTPLTAVILADAITDDELMRLIHHGADAVLVAQDAQLGTFVNEPFAAAMVELIAAHSPAIVLAAATSAGRTLMPYVAIKAHAGLTADCTELDIEPDSQLLLQTRPAIGGNILATIKTPTHRPQMATVRPHSSRPLPADEGRTGTISRHELVSLDGACQVTVESFDADTAAHHLEEADIVVAAGRGIKKADNLSLIDDLADALDAAVGASREVIDRNWLDYSHQVGLSGKTVTPRAYVAAGIRGAIQHLAGMQTAEAIIAINKDPDAPIFNVADIGIVGDLFDVLPALTAAIRKVKGQ